MVKWFHSNNRKISIQPFLVTLTLRWQILQRRCTNEPSAPPDFSVIRLLLSGTEHESLTFNKVIWAINHYSAITLLHSAKPEKVKCWNTMTSKNWHIFFEWKWNFLINFANERIAIRMKSKQLKAFFKNIQWYAKIKGGKKRLSIISKTTANRRSDSLESLSIYCAKNLEKI